MPAKRHAMIQQILDSRGEVTLTELHERCPQCSVMTLRRDLIALEQQGLLIRTRGGAVALSRLAQGVEGRYSLRAQVNMEQKGRVARCVAALLDESRPLYLDSGTTVMCLAKALRNRPFNVLTSGANIALELAGGSKCAVTLIGGQLSPNTLSISGGLALDFAARLNIDVAIMGASGFTLQNGFTSGSPSEHDLKRAVIERAREVIVLMDNSKLERSLPFTFATLANIHALVVDAPLPRDVRAEAKRLGVRVYVARD